MTGSKTKGHLLPCNMPHITLQKAIFRGAKDGLLHCINLQGVTPSTIHTLTIRRNQSVDGSFANIP
jgi:hypothetical protein